jgi:hypothetical protein
MRALGKLDDNLTPADFDASSSVDKATKQSEGRGLGKSSQATAQTLIQHGCRHGQREIEIHIQTHIAAQAVQMKERNLLSQGMLYVVSLGVGLQRLPSGQRFRQVVGE